MIAPLPLWAVVAAYALCANAQDDASAPTTSSLYPIYGTGSASFLSATDGVTSVVIEGKSRTYTQTQSAGGIEVRYPLPTPSTIAGLEERGHKKHHTTHHKKAKHHKKVTHHKTKKHPSKKTTSKHSSSKGKGSSSGASAGAEADSDDGEEPTDGDSLTYDLVDLQCGVATDGLPSDCTLYGVQQSATSTVLSVAYKIPGGVSADNFVQVLIPAPTAAPVSTPGPDGSTADAAPATIATSSTAAQTADAASQTKGSYNPLSPSSNAGLSYAPAASIVSISIVIASALFLI